MKFFKNLIIRIIVISVGALGLFFWYKTPSNNNSYYKDIKDTSNEIINKESTKEIEKSSDNNDSSQKNESIAKELLSIEVNLDKLPKKIMHKVPFIVQAPEAQWHDPRFQDACEEASILMIHRWKNNKGSILLKSSMTKELEEMFKAEQKFFGPDIIDTSAEDTAKFAKYYFGDEYITLEAKYDLMFYLLSQGYVIAVPTNGKALGNPHFSNGGPDRHMLVIIGYDLNKKEFITNDPGTRKGKKYRYSSVRLFNAIRDYKTGHKEPIEGSVKNMIIIKKD